ncbi:hypothetical protein J7302_21660 [Pseudomonas sp. DB1]|uniref:Uncharacterized protein n=1 Tax=Metapseudomonas boanensis TaxID=2822138 RepID=A0ABS5XLY8_9GAMM|nr:hypothetical protein [Pseudomonas boanensis]
MSAEQAEVMGQEVAVERFAQLGAERTATNTASQSTKDGARHGSERDADGPGESTERCAGLTTSEGSADATRNTTDGADGRADFHGVVEGSDFWGVAARALQ